MVLQQNIYLVSLSLVCNFFLDILLDFGGFLKVIFKVFPQRFPLYGILVHIFLECLSVHEMLCDILRDICECRFGFVAIHRRPIPGLYQVFAGTLVLHDEDVLFLPHQEIGKILLHVERVVQIRLVQLLDLFADVHPIPLVFEDVFLEHVQLIERVGFGGHVLAAVGAHLFFVLGA